MTLEIKREMTETSSHRDALLVTGGTGGLGAAILERLVEPGLNVAFTYRSNHSAAEALADRLREQGANVRAAAIDLTEADQVAKFVNEVIESFEGIGTLVHAAGPHIPMVHLSKVPPAQFTKAMDDEVSSFFNLVSAALPSLRGSRGSVVAVTTAATSRYPTRDGLSSTPKAAIEALVRAFAVEEGRYGVRFNSVGPGMLTDGMAVRLIASGDLDERALDVARANIPLRRFGVAADIAETVAFLASDKANFITAQKIDVDGGYSA